MEKFLPDYLNYDMKLPHEYSYNFEWLVGLIKWSIMWKNINYKQVDLDVQDVQVALKQQLLSVKFPALKKWEIDADQTVIVGIFPETSKV